MATALAPLLVAGTSLAAPVELRDPEIRAGLEALAHGQPERARRILGMAAPRRHDECRAFEDRLDADHPERLAACLGAAEAYLGLGLALGASGNEPRAYDAFRSALEIDPTRFPDPASTPPKVRRVFDAARRATLPADRAPGAIASLRHRPPLVAVRGNPVALDVARGEPWRDAGSLAVVYAIGTVERGTYRVGARDLDDGHASAEIPAAATLVGAPIYYRWDAVDGAGRVHRGRWYPLIVRDSLASAPLEILRSEIEGPSLEAVTRISTLTATGPRSSPRTDAAAGLAQAPPAAPGGLVGFVVSLLP